MKAMGGNRKLSEIKYLILHRTDGSKVEFNTFLRTDRVSVHTSIVASIHMMELYILRSDN